MKLTDNEAIKALKKARICELEDMISDYPESDVDGRSDWDMIANEAGWLLDSFCSYDTVHHDDLEECYEIIRDSRRINPQYSSWDLKRARKTVNEFNRLYRFVQYLKGRGLYCPYC